MPALHAAMQLIGPIEQAASRVGPRMSEMAHPALFGRGILVLLVDRSHGRMDEGEREEG